MRERGRERGRVRDGRALGGRRPAAGAGDVRSLSARDGRATRAAFDSTADAAAQQCLAHPRAPLDDGQSSWSAGRAGQGRRAGFSTLESRGSGWSCVVAVIPSADQGHANISDEQEADLRGLASAIDNAARHECALQRRSPGALKRRASVAPGALENHRIDLSQC